MAVHETRRRVRHAPDDVFELVSNVREYPKFIKWIRAMRVLSENEAGGRGDLTAQAIIGYKFVRERFTTNVKFDRTARAIDVAFVDGPFTALDNRWRFHALPDGSTGVDFWIRYQFRNPVLQALLNANFDRAVNKLVAAFEAGAHERYPPAGDPAMDDVAALASLERAAQ